MRTDKQNMYIRPEITMAEPQKDFVVNALICQSATGTTERIDVVMGEW